MQNGHVINTGITLGIVDFGNCVASKYEALSVADEKKGCSS